MDHVSAALIIMLTAQCI